MNALVEEAIRQIDDVLVKYEQLEASHRVVGSYQGSSWDYLKPPSSLGAEVYTLLQSALLRLAPDGEQAIQRALTSYQNEYNPEGSQIRCLAGALRALKADYQTGRLKRFGEMVQAGLFSDFLEIAEHFLEEDKGYKDAAAVIAGGVLEQHLRKLCDKHGIPTTTSDSSGKPIPKKLDTMNADLAKAGAYDKNEQKQVTAWAGIRNDAAHAHYDKYVQDQIVMMVAGIRGFLARNPA